MAPEDHRDSTPEIELRVHEGDDPRITRVLDLIDEAARPRPLREVLGALVSEVAAVIGAPVASVYVRDSVDEELLVIQANVGFPGDAVGRVQLRVGEGLTGFAAECMRPVSAAVAQRDSHYKGFPGLGEEAFPTFLALPILVGRRAEAVLVLQRLGGHRFSGDEVLLATALATTFAYALERARARDEGADGDAPEAATPRKARLAGTGLSPGAALGRVETLPTFEGLSAVARSRGLDAPLDPAIATLRLENGLAQVLKDLSRCREQVEGTLSQPDRERIATLFLFFEDQRFRRELDAQAVLHPDPVAALREVARTYARAPYQVGADRSSTDRSVEAEFLCLALAGRLVDVRLPSQGSALTLTDRLPTLLALAAAGHRASAVAVSGPLAPDSLGVRVLVAAEVPLVGGVGGLFAWAREGDRVLVDGENGVVRVNPSAATVARFRREAS